MVNKPLIGLLKVQELDYIPVGLDTSPVFKKFKWVVINNPHIFISCAAKYTLIL